MSAARRISLSAPPAERARYLARHYADVVADRAAFDATLARLPVHPGRKALAGWRALADAADLEALAADLIETHYDPAYGRSSRKAGVVPLATVTIPRLESEHQETAADQIAALLPTPEG